MPKAIKHRPFLANRASIDTAPIWKVMVENDQAVGGRTLDELSCFFAAADAPSLTLGMSFDIGNWQLLANACNEQSTPCRRGCATCMSKACSAARTAG